MMREKASVLKKLDFQNIVFPVKRIEKALEASLNYMVELRLSSCNIISSECLSIAQNPHFRYLQSLDLSCNPIKLSGLLHLIDSKTSNLSNLKRIDMYYCGISGSSLD
jgi:hypothetical protein